ncbi:MAG: S9 family peptidase [Gemmatimonadota bacterium]
MRNARITSTATLGLLLAPLSVPMSSAPSALPGARPARAQEPVELTLESMNRTTYVRDPQLSPDGRDVVFVSNRSGRSKLWLMSRDGAGARLLVDDEGSESSPRWSPAGDRIAFLRDGEEGTDLWVVPRDGGTARRVTADPEGERDPAWSPDGTRLAFLSERAGHQDVFLANVETGEVRQLTFETNPWDEGRWAPEWSPDGHWIAYVSNRSDPLEDDLWIVDVETGDTEKLTSTVYVMSNPVWSPNGRHIAFNAVRKSEFWYGDQSDLYVVDMPERTLRRIETQAHASDGNGGIEMAWSPASRFLYFRYEWEGNANLWSVSVDGGVATKLTYEEGGLGNFCVGGDGRSIVYVRSTPTEAGEVHRFDIEGGAPIALTDWATDFRDLRPPHRIAFRARDGLYILGYLYLPSGFDPARRYPALVQAHGGGNNAYGNGFHALEHWLSHEGFVVLAIEYRGSAGHGRAFQDLSLGDWAAGQGWDAVAAAEYLHSLPYVNGNVGMYGGSYGGIMTMAAVTRTSEPFDAVAPLYGIFDWERAYEDGDRLMRFWIIQGHLGFKPGEAPARFERTASIRHLEGVDTDLPFLVLHGERDRRAPFSQSQMLVEALRARGNPVQFHSYPDEGHGFRRPENRIDAYGRLVAFFREHLVEEPGEAAP